MNDIERNIVEGLFKTREAIRETEEKLKAVKAEHENKISELCELLRSEGKDATARYEGLGWISTSKPQLYASYRKENQETIFKWVKKLNREDLIKENIHHTSFSAFVSELIGEGKTLPEEVSYYLKPTVKFYERTEK